MPNDMLAEVGRPSALEVRFEIQARWRDVVALAGLDDAMHKPENTLMLAGAILHDATVTKMRMKPEFQIAQGAAFDTNWTKLFDAMGPGGRAALKQRIQKAHALA